MRDIYKNYLFDKHVLVLEPNAYDFEAKREVEHASSQGMQVQEGSVQKKSSEETHVFEVLFSLANLFGIRITEGEQYADRSMIAYVSDRLGIRVPEPFYRGFPQSVRELSSDQLLFDQLVHYTVTYGFGYFEQAGHSLFEEGFERAAFQENCEIKEFRILTEAQAVSLLAEYVEKLLLSTRPLNENQYVLVKSYIREYDYEPSAIASKNTAIRLLLDLRDMRFAKNLKMSDVIKVVDALNYQEYDNENLHKLHLKNQDRKFLTRLINTMFASESCDIRTCYEKKAEWCGLLHHIHYQADNEIARSFVDSMRGKGNQSVFSEFERALAAHDIQSAVTALKEGKGTGALLRNLSYIISRCETEAEVQSVIDQMDTKNVIILIQLLIRYSYYSDTKLPRTFKFTKNNQLKVHAETEEETARRKSMISREHTELLRFSIHQNLRRVLQNRVGKVYLDPAMKKIALPLQESASQGGYGVLAKGSRIPIPESKKLRAFTYWEKVNDIDLSVFGVDEEGNHKEFSWRTMAGNQSDAITYSGDETSGYHGGSEYFDIDLERFKEQYPTVQYLIFCDNVYSGVPFCECVCRAGYMTRDIEDSGQVYEPKTVKTAYQINCNSLFAYLFAIDLSTNELVWLNIARDSYATVAGTTSLAFLTEYIYMTDVINMYTFFEWMAAELTNDPADADLVVSDQSFEGVSSERQIHSYDFEKLFAYMN